jgi:hypothetical protein
VSDGLQSLLASGRGGVPGLWIDCLSYVRRLFLGGDDPWTDPARFVSAFTQAQQLLKSDLVDVRVENCVQSWLAGEGAGLKAARRPTSELKQILGDDGLRDGLLAILATLGNLARGCGGIALTVPSPRRWLRICVERIGGDLSDYLDEDNVEMCAMYVADFLRVYAESGVSVILLEEDSDPGSDPKELYQPIYNVASGYQWDVVLLVPGDVASDPGEGAVGACIVDPAAFDALSDGSARGTAIPANFWSGKSAKLSIPEGADFSYVRIPEDANPELVLERLTMLRNGS